MKPGASASRCTGLHINHFNMNQTLLSTYTKIPFETCTELHYLSKNKQNPFLMGNKEGLYQ